LMYRH